jgi:hypothetical protein
MPLRHIERRFGTSELKGVPSVELPQWRQLVDKHTVLNVWQDCFVKAETVFAIDIVNCSLKSMKKCSLAAIFQSIIFRSVTMGSLISKHCRSYWSGLCPIDYRHATRETTPGERRDTACTTLSSHSSACKVNPCSTTDDQRDAYRDRPKAR